MSRLRALTQLNVRWLDQAIDLVSTLSDHAYAQTPAGSHLRHILDFYDSFLAGLGTGRIDYDARLRDPRTSHDRHYAIDRLRRTQSRLWTIPLDDRPLLVRMEDAILDTDPWMPSSVSRELQSLSGHTVHHFALIAVTLRGHGVQLHSDFGVAPSTLRHRREAA
jgi:hypothetical protein